MSEEALNNLETFGFIFAAFIVLMIILKLVFKDIKFKELVLLTLATGVTGFIAPVVYIILKNSKGGSSSSSYDHYSSSDRGKAHDMVKNAKSSYTDIDGRTTYKDENGKVIGKSFTDSMGRTSYYDNDGRSAGKSYTDSYGTTTFDDGSKAHTDCLGSTTFDDGSKAYTDSYGSTNYYDND